MGIMSLIGWLFGADTTPPSDAMKLDGASEAALGRSLSALPAGERGWIAFAEARTSFSKRMQNTPSAKRTMTAEKPSSRSQRGTSPLSASCRSRGWFISHATMIDRPSGGKRRLFLVSCDQATSLRVASAKKVRALE